MELVINRCFGGFALSDEVCEYLGCGTYDYSRPHERNDWRLVEAVKKFGDRANTFFSDLQVVELPDETTDYTIEEYDGAEKVIYVVNGKLHFA